MGIIGYGRIGQATGRIAQALGMKCGPTMRTGILPGSETCQYANLDEVLAQSDVIALHCPLFPETEGIINRENIAKMKDGVIILNNSRGPLIVEKDLAEALDSGKVAAAAGCGVHRAIKGNNPLLKAKNCILTPHISWAPKESRQRLMDIAVDNLEMFLKGEVQNAVNL